MKVTICIPTYGMNGEGSFYLQKNLSSIFLQTIKPHEVLISDHSTDDEVEKTAELWKSFLNIKYYRNDRKKGTISANLNNCIEKSEGDVLDFMLQDDYYFAPNSLQKRIETLGDKQWSATGTIHYAVEKNQFYRHLVPSYRDDIYLGYNSIGSPSVLTIKKLGCPLFDENLLMLTDCDYYKQLFVMFGLPSTASDITSVSCVWEGQSQKKVSQDKIDDEVRIVKEKYESK